jgi:O-antigen/teichoic acid export membrane protein
MLMDSKAVISGSTRRLIAINASWLLYDKIIRIAVGLIVTVWIARYLGPSEFGLWSYAIAVASLFGTLAGLGLDGILVRDLLEKSAERSIILGTAFVLKLAAASVALLLSVLTIVILDQGAFTVTVLVFLSATVFVIQSVYVVDSLFQALQLNKYTVISQNIAFFLSSGIRVAMIFAQADVLSFCFANVLESAAASLFVMIAYRRSGGLVFEWRYSGKLAKAMLGDSWPLMLSGFAYIVYIRIDQIMIAQLLDSRAVGLYSAAARISEAWNFIPASLIVASFPSIIASRRTSKALYEDRLRRLLNLLAIFCIVAAAAISASSTWIIRVFIGDDYLDAAPALCLLAWGGVFTAMGFASGRWMISENIPIFALLRNIAGATANLCLNFILIPRHGIQGAAIATLISFSIANFFFYLVHHKLRPLFFMTLRSFLFIDFFELLIRKVGGNERRNT